MAEFKTPQNRPRPWLSTLVSLMLLATAIALSSGCGTTTQRVATEQLLMSDALDRAVERLDFSAVRDSDVFLDTTYINGIKGNPVVNTNYLISSIRQQLLAANCKIHDHRDEADIILEPRIGALGTDGHEVTYGIPQTSSISTAAALVSSTPLLPSIPEISVGRSDAQTGIAKIALFAYDRETRLPIWQSGIAKAESTSKNTWLLGAGPFQRGSIYDGMRFAGQDFKKTQNHDGTPTTVDYAAEYYFSRDKIEEEQQQVRTAELEKAKEDTQKK